MKKSKFLLLGSVASMAAIPFVAAKCGGTKEENKKPAEMPGGTEQPGKPGDTDQPAQPNPGTTPSTPAKPGKTPERMAQDTDVSGADISGSIKTPDTTATKTKLSDALKTIANNNLGKVQVSKEDKDKKEKVEEAIKTALVAKVTTLKGKDLKLKADLSKNSVVVSSNDFEGEVTLKFEVETSSGAKAKLSDALKTIANNNLGKVQVSKEDKDKKEKVEEAIKTALVAKVTTLKGKDLKLKADLSKNSVVVSSNDFEGEVTLKFEVETSSGAKAKLSDALKTIANNNLGKVQVSKEDKDKKEKVEEAIKTALVAKVTTLKGKDLKLKADLSKNSVVVSSNDFEGEVTLKFEVETSSGAKAKLSDALKTIANNNLGKVQVSKEDKDKKEKVEEAIKTALVAKVTTLKGKDLKLKADLSKNSVVVSSNDFEGEVTLKFEVYV
ncbi:variable surface lipoprotein [Mycoplasmopsis agalactiae]|uniref:variable surface lipoprotein n=1 Tax=Mycoplasmopsis agalactiae TaxID=2110 RepID=UPI001F2CAE28|nr:variable surface lipoprotein [Mycoplasmopsis agalactiae]